MSVLEHALKTLFLIAAPVFGGGLATATVLRECDLTWTWRRSGSRSRCSSRG